MKTVVGNWKMHLGVRESVALARGVLRSLRGQNTNPAIVLCPSFTSLSEVYKVLARSSVQLGAQNVSVDRTGAYTGEVSSLMLEDVGVKSVLIGHSERRRLFAESDDLIKQKVDHILSTRITPFLFVGESDHDPEKRYEVVKAQLQAAIPKGGIKGNKELVFVYEPVWAIGSGEPAAVEDVVEMHEFIRMVAAKRLGVSGDSLRVLYGGSVDQKNAYQFLRETQIDGVVVGGASIKAKQFNAIIDAARDVLDAQGE